jgi:hypothetical protein
MAHYKIKKGPSKLELMIGFFHKFKLERNPVEFGVSLHEENKFTIPIDVVVNKLEWEDGSGESWNFDGYALFYTDASGNKPTRAKVSGHFRTGSRIGWLEIESDEHPVIPPTENVGAHKLA